MHLLDKLIRLHNHDFMQAINKQLVFVEDDAHIRNLVVEGLSERGFDVVEAATAEDAMQCLIGAPAPLLVVTDIDLGAGRNGLELADWLHERWPELNVIFASGRLDRLNGRALDSRETRLAKPFRLKALVERVRCFVPSSAMASRVRTESVDDDHSTPSGRPSVSRHPGLMFGSGGAHKLA